VGGRDLPGFRVSGLVARPPGRRPAPAAYFTQAMASQLYRHPGQADLLAVLPTPGGRTDTGRLAAEVHAVAGDRYPVLTGAQRGYAEDLGAASDKENISIFGWSAFMPVVMISLFVVAGAVGLSLAGRRRYFALLRAVGATPGQVRRAVAGELAVLGVVAGLLGYPIGTIIGRLAVAGLVRHDLLPAYTHCWTAWWVQLVACGAGLVVAELAGFVAGWRAARTRPVLALSEASVDRRRPNPLRLLLGLDAAAGGVTLSIVTFQQAHTPTDELNFALLTLLTFVAAVGLLGPMLVLAGEPLLRLPARLLGGPSARLALADISRRPRRIASAVVAVGLSVGFLGTVYLVSATVVHADQTQTVSRLAADEVVTAPGGLAPNAVPALAGLSGVDAAVGVTSTNAYTTLSGGDAVAAAAFTPGPIPSVLRLGVIAGRLKRISAGQVALSQLEAGNQKVGSAVLIYLADGTRYRARVTAIYTRGMGFGDVIIPADAAGGGHLGTSTVDEVLLRGRPARDLTTLQARFPGLSVHSRAASNTQARKLDDQSQYLNTLLVVLIALLAAVTLVNTMTTATVEHRESLHLLDRLGATRRQRHRYGLLADRYRRADRHARRSRGRGISARSGNASTHR
jgi:putative ABC transport system permease protein